MTADLVLVGAGKWGQRYIETLKNFDVNLKVANRENWRQLIDTKPQGVIVSTHPDSHIEIASHALSQGIPTMIEKPLAFSVEEAKKLEAFSAPFLVNHIQLFSDRYQQMKKDIGDKRIHHISSAGYNKGPVRKYSSLWDYGPHDISMILDLLNNEVPQTVSAREMFTPSNFDTFLYEIELEFTNCKSFSVVGNGGSQKKRIMEVEFDNLVTRLDGQISDETPPLTNALNVFMSAVHQYDDDDYRFGLDLSLKVLDVLEKCQQSSNSNH